MASIGNRFKKAWNAFLDRDTAVEYSITAGPGSSSRPDRPRFTLGNAKSTVAPILTRIAIDAAAIPMRHVRTDENGQFIENVMSGLNDCITIDANIDQTGRSFIQDAVQSMCDEGAVALVPVDKYTDPERPDWFDIASLRVAKIVQWHPESIRVNLYNDRTGMKEEIPVLKRDVVIIENPLYSVMNEPNSTLSRLISKINLLDVIDSQSGAGKLDLIIQLPYAVKTELRKQQAENRKQAIEEQLMNTKYGIAYIDSTEKVTQLNRPAENNIMSQIEFLTRMLFSQLGITEAVYNGTADEAEWINYYNRTVEPMLAAVTDGMTRRFITPELRRKGHAVKYYRNPFRLVTAKEFGDISDSLNRNEILTGNELRGIIGYRPSTDPRADELKNKNISDNQPAEPAPAKTEQNM